MTPNMETRQNLVAFESELTQLINKYCLENLSDTPDYILARHLVGCLYIFNSSIGSREDWFENRKKGRTK